MAIKTEENNQFDSLKWGVVLALVVAGVVGHYMYSSQPAVILLVGWLILVAVALLIASQTAKGRLAWQFAREARMELRKVVWPTKKETLRMTGLVVLMVIVASLILWGFDNLLLWIVSILTGQRV